MTPHQEKLVNFIVLYQAQHNGVSPTFRELRDGMGYRNRGGLHTMVDRLRRDGYLTHEKYRARSLRLLKYPTRKGQVMFFGCVACRDSLCLNFFPSLTVTPASAERIPNCANCNGVLTKLASPVAQAISLYRTFVPADEVAP